MLLHQALCRHVQGNTISADQINCILFDPLVPLAKQLGMDICNLPNGAFEDIFLALYWRHAHTINFNRDLSWARLIADSFFPFWRRHGNRTY